MSEHTDTTGQQFWEARYREHERVWSGEPNVALVLETTALEPGTALDLGCGEGGDAIWLARQGWRVTATDISTVALERARDYAAEAGLAERIDFQHHDVTASFPAGQFDLVSLCFLHSHDATMPGGPLLRTAAARVNSGGTLLVVGHAGPPPSDHAHEHQHLPTPAEVLAELGMPSQGWEILLSQERERDNPSPGGHSADSIVKLRRT